MEHMPELPEVQTIVSQLAPALRGARIESVHIEREDVIREGRRALATKCRGRKVEQVSREGKRLWFRLNGPGRNDYAALVIHLGMSGRLTLDAGDTPLLPHTHLRIRFAGNPHELRFRDPRRFGGVWYLLQPTDDKTCTSKNSTATRTAPGLAPLGPDALTIRTDCLREITRRRRQIKALLLDQQIISGLGNIYCDEALYRAGIHPVTPASQLSDVQVRRLADCIRATLRSAVAAGGSTLRDYRDSTGAEGWFQVNHRVYGREGQPCRQCGAIIQRSLIAGRSTHTCPNCQTATKAKPTRRRAVRP